MTRRIEAAPVLDRYATTHRSYQVLAADGHVLNYGWDDPDRAAQDAARRGAGAYVAPLTSVRTVTASDRVLIDSDIPEERWPLIRADAHRMLNMARDAGRPSDAMRSSVRAFKAGTLTDESFAATRPSGFYPDDAR